MQGENQPEQCVLNMMSDKLDSFETVCEGWLTKSPPTTRILRAVSAATEFFFQRTSIQLMFEANWQLHEVL